VKNIPEDSGLRSYKEVNVVNRTCWKRSPLLVNIYCVQCGTSAENPTALLVDIPLTERRNRADLNYGNSCAMRYANQTGCKEQICRLSARTLK
jgi:hypothetical protein